MAINGLVRPGHRQPGTLKKSLSHTHFIMLVFHHVAFFSFYICSIINVHDGPDAPLSFLFDPYKYAPRSAGLGSSILF